MDRIVSNLIKRANFVLPWAGCAVERIDIFFVWREDETIEFERHRAIESREIGDRMIVVRHHISEVEECRIIGEYVCAGVRRGPIRIFEAGDSPGKDIIGDKHLSSWLEMEEGGTGAIRYDGIEEEEENRIAIDDAFAAIVDRHGMVHVHRAFLDRVSNDIGKPAIRNVDGEAAIASRAINDVITINIIRVRSGL